MKRAARVFVALGLWMLASCDRRFSQAHPTPAQPLRRPDSSSGGPAGHDLSGRSAGTQSGGRSGGLRCVRDDGFPSPWNVPEASAAAEVMLLPQTPEILVVADSEHDGAAMAWRSGHPPRPLKLPLDDVASDDLEGMAWFDGRLYTMTSSGGVRRFAPDGRGGLRREGGAYRIAAPPLSCPDLRSFNCGKDWEGLCLRAPGSRQRCDGYAASKTEGALYCVTRQGERLAIDPLRPPIRLELAHLPGKKDVLSDCAFGAAGGPAQDLLFVTTNVFGGSVTYVVDEATGKTEALDLVGTPSNEAQTVGSDGSFYEFMDSNTDTSLAIRYECTGWR